MSILLAFFLLTDGSAQTMAVRFETLALCEAGMPKVLDIVERNRTAIKGYSISCAPIQIADPV